MAVIQPNVINVEQVAPEQKVVFNVQSGNILITSHATQTLEFSWHLLSGDEEKVTVETSTSADAATVTAKVRSDNYGPGTSLAIEAAVPDVSRLEVEAAGGSIGIAAHNGPVVARASGGNVTVDAAGGPTDVTVSGGNLRVGRAAAGLSASVSGGSADVGSCSGTVDIGVTGGTVSVRYDDTVPKVSLNSVGGNATLAVSREAGFHLHAEAIGGFVRIAPMFLGDATVTTSFFDGRIHGGGGSVQLNSIGGFVRLMPK